MQQVELEPIVEWPKASHARADPEGKYRALQEAASDRNPNEKGRPHYADQPSGLKLFRNEKIPQPHSPRDQLPKAVYFGGGFFQLIDSLI